MTISDRSFLYSFRLSSSIVVGSEAATSDAVKPIHLYYEGTVPAVPKNIFDNRLEC